MKKEVILQDFSFRSHVMSIKFTKLNAESL